MISRIALFLLVTASLACAQYSGAKPVSDEVRKGFDSITTDYCKEILTYLAGDECQGRRTGTPGYQKAADYVAARFKEFGLKPVGDNDTYFQGVPFNRARTNSKESTLTVGKTRFVCGKDVMFNASDAELAGDVVFISGDTEALLEDSKVLLGKIVVIRGDTGSWNGGVTRQMRRHRPAAVLLVADEVGESRWAPAGRRRRRGQRVAGTITLKAAKKLARACGVSRALNGKSRSKFATAKTGKRAEIKVVSERGSHDVPNVVGLLEGSDPQLKHEMVICGSHLDHLGVGTDGRIRYGADDDGSGSSGLVALARAFTKNGKRPRRSVLFLAFCGEEMGLIGSKYYANNPIFPLSDAVCELQMESEW